MQSHGSKGTLDISAVAQNAKNFDDTLKKLLNDYFKTFFESENAVLPLFEGYTFTETNRSKSLGSRWSMRTGNMERSYCYLI